MVVREATWSSRSGMVIPLAVPIFSGEVGVTGLRIPEVSMQPRPIVVGFEISPRAVESWIVLLTGP